MSVVSVILSCKLRNYSNLTGSQNYSRMKKNNYSKAYKDVFLDIERNKNLLLSKSHAVYYKFNQSSLKYSYFSPAIEDLTGYSMDELKEFGFDKAIHKEVSPDFDEVPVSSENNGILKKKNYYSRYWIETKTGQWKLIENYAFSEPGKNGNADSVSGFMKDVTSLNNYLISILQEKARLNAIIEMAEVIILVLDQEGNVELVNRKACEVLGYQKEEIIGKNWIDNFVPDQVKKNVEEVSAGIFEGKEQKYSYFENAIVTKSGELREFGWHNKPYRDEDGNLLFFLSSGEDITEKIKEGKVQQVISNILQASNNDSKLEDFFSYIRTEISKLMKAENFYIALYDKNTGIISFPYTVDKYDPKFPPKKFGNGLTEYVLTSGKSALINKAKDNELVGQKKTEIIGTQSAIWLGIPLKIGDFTIGVLAVQDYENENTYTENEQKILEVIAYSISRAIERKRLEKDRGRLIKRLEKMNSSKDKLFSLISHDLRSPFNSLLGFSEILTSEYESLTTEEIKEYIRAIYDSSKNLYSITNNLLQFSRFQMGKIEFKPTSIDLKLLVSDVVKLLKGNIVKKQLQISEEIEEDMKIFVDEDMLSSVLQNLISNAIKFTYKNGKISIKASKISIDNKAFLKIAISDNGVGISTFDLEKILEGNYYTTPGTDKEFGTGLGLSLVKEFIAKNGGTLEIKSKLKAGSTFTFTVPQTR